MKIPAALYREWYGKNGRLAKSNFRDLETRPGDDRLSSRGDGIHDDFRKGAIDADEMSERRATAAARQETNRAALARLPFRTRLDREVWEMHTKDIGLRAIAKAHGLSYRQTRNIVRRLERERLDTARNKSTMVSKWHLQRLIDQASESTLVKLARALIAQRSTSRSTT